MKQVFSLVIVLFLLSICAVAVHAEYSIDLKTNPGQIIARDNPFAEYEDLGELPELAITVKDADGMPVQDVTISVTITHVDSLILGTGFPWVEGKELLFLTQYEEDGVLTIPALLFPLRGEYTVDVKVMDALGNEQIEQLILEVMEPFKQSTLNGIIFLVVLFIFGSIVGLIFGKDLLRKKAHASVSKALAMLLIISMMAIPFAFAHSEQEMDETGIVHYEDEQVTFYTTPEIPDIGIPTTFTIKAMDENGLLVNNAIAHVLIANEEEGFDVIELELFSQTGTFTFNYGIFDGAPHIATVHIEPTAQSSIQFAEIEREYPFAGEAHNPPFGAKLLATAVMLATMLLGFAGGVMIRKMAAKGEAHE